MQNVYVRLVTYFLSFLIGLIPAWAAGWLIVSIVDGWIHVQLQIEGFMTAMMGGGALTAGVFKKFGTK